MEPHKKSVIEAALNVAARGEWSRVCLEDIATEADVSLDQLYTYFDDKEDILRGFGKMIDEGIREAFEGQSLEGDVGRDRLFDVLMERFDLLNDYRDGVLSVMKAYHCDPKQAAIALPHLAKSMAMMLELCDIEVNGWKGCIKILGLSGLYLDIAFRVWAKDESADMSKTMAALDKGLGRAEQIAHSFQL